MSTIIGLDLAGSPRRPTGYAIGRLANGNCRVFDYGVVYDDRSLLGILKMAKPRLVVVDSPLTFPRQGWFRRVDIAMKKLGYKVLPPMWKGMQMLVRRAIKIKSLLEEAGIYVLETHPRSAWLSSSCDSPIKAVKRVCENVPESPRSLKKDVVDALVALAVGVEYMRGNAVGVCEKDGCIYLLPKLC
ncbi:MAG TPA: DUF429 domain-containing protein [Pyrodictium sp.]|nr:DUF429 domain-containing protein [Pyrodictium sp.]